MAKPKLNLRVLDGDKLRVLRLQAEVATSETFFLAGGTGITLRLHHRLSDDLDWFTAKRFDVPELEQKLERLPEKPTTTKQHGAHTLRAYYGDLETSFIAYDQVPAKPELVKVGGVDIALADMDILATLGAAQLSRRVDEPAKVRGLGDEPLDAQLAQAPRSISSGCRSRRRGPISCARRRESP